MQCDVWFGLIATGDGHDEAAQRGAPLEDPWRRIGGARQRGGAHVADEAVQVLIIYLDVIVNLVERTVPVVVAVEDEAGVRKVLECSECPDCVLLRNRDIVAEGG